eukprot:TRINITY_DN3714_c0_g1_i1.p1 TRINITY_DN3714_c0_g1~~TRINITY_DN3714_c0_g1_i1.p1  ORF type:complete len:159 (+),score=5.45 TRINITY_DN3714_c0_g1_i1:431-907(+)
MHPAERLSASLPKSPWGGLRVGCCFVASVVGSFLCAPSCRVLHTMGCCSSHNPKPQLADVDRGPERCIEHQDLEGQTIERAAISDSEVVDCTLVQCTLRGIDFRGNNTLKDCKVRVFDIFGKVTVTGGLLEDGELKPGAELVNAAGTCKIQGVRNYYG